MDGDSNESRLGAHFVPVGGYRTDLCFKEYDTSWRPSKSLETWHVECASLSSESTSYSDYIESANFVETRPFVVLYACCESVNDA